MLSSCSTHEHEFVEWEYGEKYHWQVCTDPECDDKNDYAKHVYTEGGLTIPSCTEGTVCLICKADNAEIAEHIWDDGKVTKRPTPTDSGRLTHTCEHCSATKNTELAPVNLYLPDVPFEITTSGGSVFRVSEMIPTYHEDGFAITVIGTKISYVAGYQKNSAFSLDWKLYDDKDRVALSGKYTSPSVIIGEVFTNTFVIETNTDKIFRLEIIK
jgi:hypothetical protein